jgi:hypothetical protein
MASSHSLLLAAILLAWAHLALGVEVDVGYDAFGAAQQMVNLASHSWEWGTAAEALLELYNPELSVFGPNPFPNGGVPQADPNTFALQYAKQFIDVNGQVFVSNSAVGKQVFNLNSQVSVCSDSGAR